MKQNSKLSAKYGILFAADLPSESEMFQCLGEIHTEIAAVKLGNSLLYETGASLVARIKERYDIPVVADIKLTDVSHIACRVASKFAYFGTDALVLSGVVGPEVMRDVASCLPQSCEAWAFTEFTNDSGLIDEHLADISIEQAVKSGIKGLQVPGTRPYRAYGGLGMTLLPVQDRPGADPEPRGCLLLG